LRSRLIHEIRRFFRDWDYLEIETPIRTPTQAPEVHIDAQESGKWLLQTSPELCMKRLIAAGYPRIFQICKCFRKGERGNRNLPEFTMLEWYHQGQTLFDLMKQCEDLIRWISRGLGKGDTLPYQGKTIYLETPWPRQTVSQIFFRYGSISLKDALALNRFDEIMGIHIEPELGWETPIFLYNYPASLGSLARINPENPDSALRFELYAGGLELCNAFTELTDPKEQKIRFEKEMKSRSGMGKSAYSMPHKFLEALEFMPETAGCAMGVDRLVMLFADTSTIDPVVAFPPETL
ncbi:MAG: EF-P lysine aminoacylase EpmA, partial [Thermodesulfobacteriota bacterium]